MAKRDVELVLRAKDQASNLLKKVTDALKEFEAAEQSAGKSSGEFSTRIDKLKASLSKFASSSGGEKSIKRLSAELKNATTSLKDMESEATRLSSRIEKLSQQALRAAQNENKMNVELDRATAQLRKQQSALAEAVKRRKELARARSDEARAAARADRSAEARLRRLSKTSEELARARARWKELAREMSSTASASKRLEASYQSAENRVRKKAAELRKLSAEYRNFSAEGSKTRATLARLDAEYEKSGQAVSRLKAELQTAKDKQKLFADASREAAQEYARLESQLNKTRNAYSRQRAEIQQAKQAVKDLLASVEQSAAAYKKVAAQADEAMRRVITGQERAARSAMTEWARAEAALRKYGGAQKALASSDPAVRGMAEKARLAREEYERLAASTEKLRGVMSRQSGSIADVKAKLEAFSSAMSRTSAATKRLGEAQRSTEGSARRLLAQTRQVSTAMRSAARNTDALRAALRRVAGATRETADTISRIRAQVIALVSAYAGLQGVSRLIHGVTEAHRSWAAAQRSVAVALNTTDQRVVAQEMDYIRKTANKLGVDLGVVAKEYSRLAVSTRGTKISMEDTRKIFEAVAGASRVMALDGEQTKRVFTALVQIASKGKIQMEELRQQLGDNLPRSIQLMAEAAGYGTGSMEEFYKAIENGNIGAETLVKFAEKMQDYFGPQLQKAMNDNTAHLQRMKNALFELLLFIGKSGLLDALSELYKSITKLANDTGFREFVSDATHLLSKLIGILRLAVEHWKVTTAVLGVFAARLAIAFGARMILQIAKFGSAIKFAAAQVRALAAAETLAAAAQTRFNLSMASGLAVLKKVRTFFAGALAVITRLSPVLLAVSAAAGALWLAWKKFGPAAKDASKATGDLSVSATKAGDSFSSAAEKARAMVDGVSTTDIQNASEQLKQYGASAEYIKRMAGEIKFNIVVEEAGSTTLTAAANTIDRMAQSLETFSNLGGGGLQKVFNDITESARQSLEMINRFPDDVRNSVSASLESLASLKDGLSQISALSDGLSGVADTLTGIAERAPALQEAAEAVAQLRAELDAVSGYGEIIVSVNVDVQGLDEVRQLKAELQELDSVAQEAFSGIPDLVAPAAKALGDAAEAAGVLTEAFVRVNEAVDQLNASFEALSGPQEVLASSAEAVQELTSALNEASVALEEYMSALDRLSGSTDELSQGLERTNAAVQQFVTALGSTAGAVTSMIERVTKLNEALSEHNAYFTKLVDTLNAASKAYQRAADAANQYYIAAQKAKLARRQGSNPSTGYTFRTPQFHKGGIVRGQGQATNGNASRHVPVAAFANAYRYATGGIAGFKPDEVPAILHRGEEVITPNDPRHRNNARRGLPDLNGAAKRLEEAAAAMAQSALLSAQSLHFSLTQAADYFYQQIVLATKDLSSQIAEFKASLKTTISDLTQKLDGLASGLSNGSVGSGSSTTGSSFGSSRTSFTYVPSGGMSMSYSGGSYSYGGSYSTSSGYSAATAYDSWDRYINPFTGNPYSWADESTVRQLEEENRRAAEEYQQALRERQAEEERRRRLAESGDLPVGGLYHNGGIVGTSTQFRVINPADYKNAYRYATGGIAGFKPDEVPAILHRGEEVLTLRDPRHRNNMFGAGLKNAAGGLSNAAGALEGSAAAFAQSSLMAAQAIHNSLTQAADYFYQQIVLATKWLVDGVDRLRKALEDSFNTMMSRMSSLSSSSSAQGSSKSGSWAQFWADQAATMRRMYGVSSFTPAHAGGIVGSSGGISSSSPYAPRLVSTAAFAGARRFHSGGFPGLAQDEVPAILQKGEEVLSRNDPRNALNAGKGGSAPAARPSVNLKIINTLDPGEIISEGLSTPEGEEAILNFFGENSEAVRRRIG